MLTADGSPNRSSLLWPAVTLAVIANLTVGVFVPGPAAMQQSDAQERAKLLELQRTAVAQLQAATRQGATVDQIRQALLDASRSLQSLGAEPDPAKPPATPLVPSLRAELRRSAADLSTLSSDDPQRVASSIGAALQLLERVRSQLEGEVALGLTFQGSYSQTKPKDPAYGGHASAMGPAPANIAVARRRRASAR